MTLQPSVIREVSRSFWNQRQNRVFLTTQLRSHLATSLIKAAVLNDYDAQYEGHRFCEEGVIEHEPIRTHGSSK